MVMVMYVLGFTPLTSSTDILVKYFIRCATATTLATRMKLLNEGMDTVKSHSFKSELVPRCARRLRARRGRAQRPGRDWRGHRFG